MKRLLLTTTIGIITSCFAQAEQPSPKPNILLICIDDLRPELPSFGKNYIHAPNMEKLFTQGRLFKRHYVQAPTCGASRFALLTGIFPTEKKQTSNNAILTHNHKTQPTFPAHLQKHGYTTVAVGKISHYPGGNTGENWDNPLKPEIPNAWTRNIASKELCAEWQHPQALMHGYANGVGRINGKERKNNKSPVIETIENARYPDDAITDAALKQIELLKSEKKPWLLAIGFLRPHLPFACDKKFLDLYTDKEIPNYSTPKPPKGDMWHSSGEFNGGYQKAADPNKDAAYAKLIIKHYAACVSSTDAHIGTILKKLTDSGLDKNTIIILWGDHGWHLGEKQIWGKHTLYHEALHSPLFVKTPAMEKPGQASNRIINSVDIYPTLCQLANIPEPDHTQGSAFIKQLKDPQAKRHEKALSYWKGNVSIITRDKHEIQNLKTKTTLQKYDLKNDPKELQNLAK